MLTIYCFRGACCERPPPSVRRRVAHDRVEKLKLDSRRESWFVRATDEKASNKEGLKESHSDINELTKAVESLRAENVVLISQLLRFENLSQDSNRLEIFTG